MKKRIFGIETEYGLLVKNSEEFPFDSMEVASKVKNHIFSKNQGVLDLHYRANDEPPGNGGFCLTAGVCISTWGIWNMPHRSVPILSIW